MRFKEGDRVRLVRCDGRTTKTDSGPSSHIGQEGVIAHVFSDHYEVRFPTDYWYYSDADLEPVEPVAAPAPSGLHLFNFTVTRKEDLGHDLRADFRMYGTTDGSSDLRGKLGELAREQLDALVVGKQYRVLIVE
jgi:hypothetical protein